MKQVHTNLETKPKFKIKIFLPQIQEPNNHSLTSVPASVKTKGGKWQKFVAEK